MRIPAALLVLLLAGCSTVYKPDELTRSKRYAVVSIMAGENIEAASKPGMGATLSGMLKAVASKDAGFSASSARILDESAPRLMKALVAQKHFTVIPEKAARTNAGFRAAASEEPVSTFGFIKTRFNVATGYKYFGDDQKLAELARKMKVDGVIAARFFYRAGETKLGVGGVLAAGTHNGATNMEIWAVDASGQRIWSDVFSESSKDSVAFIGDAVNFTTLHPLLLQSTDAAIASMLAKLDGGYR